MAAIRSRLNPWPIGIVAAFVLFLGGTAALIVVAQRDPSELVAPDYYEQELGYQRRVDQLSRTLPWASQITVQHAPDAREIRIAVPHEHAAAGLSGQMVLYRPARAGFDRAIELAPDPTGRQSVSSAGLAVGFWRARLSWSVGTNEFYADRDFVVPPSPVAGAQPMKATAGGPTP